MDEGLPPSAYATFRSSRENSAADRTSVSRKRTNPGAAGSQSVFRPTGPKHADGAYRRQICHESTNSGTTSSRLIASRNGRDV